MSIAFTRSTLLLSYLLPGLAFAAAAPELPGYDPTVPGQNPYYNLVYKSSSFVWGDDYDAGDSTIDLESFPHDGMAFDPTGASASILQSYLDDRAAGSANVGAYLGIDDIASFFEGRVPGGATLTGADYITYGAYSYRITGTVSLPAYGVSEEDVSIEYWEDDTGIEMSAHLPLSAWNITGTGLRITQYSSSGLSTGKTSTFAITSSNVPLGTAVGIFDVDFGSGASNGLVYDSLLHLGLCGATKPTVTVNKVGTVSASIIQSVLLQALCIAPNTELGRLVEGDMEASLGASDDGFGLYFTDEIRASNPLFGSGTIAWKAPLLHPVADEDVLEIRAEVTRGPAPSGSKTRTETSVVANSTLMAGPDGDLADLLLELIPLTITAGGGGSQELSGDCERRDSNTIECGCDELNDCEVTIDLGDPEPSGTPSMVGQWVEDPDYDLPLRNVEVRGVGFRVDLDVTLSGGTGICGTANFTGGGTLTVSNMKMDIDFEPILQRGNPENGPCAESLRECMVANAEVVASGSDPDGELQSCLLSAGSCSFSTLTALSVLSEEEPDMELFDDNFEASTLRYVRSQLDLGSTSVVASLSLSTGNVCVSNAKEDEAEESIEDALEDSIDDSLTEAAADDDLLGSQGEVLDRIYGYALNRAMVCTLESCASGAPAGEDTYQNKLNLSGSTPQWRLQTRSVIP